METNVPGSAPAGSTHTEQKSTLAGLEGFFDTYLRIKAPWQLPAGAKEWIVKYGPWITLVILILSAIVIIPLALLYFGVTAISIPFAAATGNLSSTTLGWVSMIISLVVLVMEGIAIPGLLKRQLSGWNMIYYAQLISVVNSIIRLDIVSAIISLVLGMYFLFQIRSYYK